MPIIFIGTERPHPPSAFIAVAPIIRLLLKSESPSQRQHAPSTAVLLMRGHLDSPHYPTLHRHRHHHYANKSDRSKMATAAMNESQMQHKISSLNISHIVDANLQVGEILLLKPYIRYIRPTGVHSMKLVSICPVRHDASHGAFESMYGRSGNFCGFTIQCRRGRNPLFHTISSTGHKQRKVTKSSFGAKIIAASDVDDLGLVINNSL